MCGIAGRFNYVSGAPVDPARLRAMCDLLAHRGPDGEGTMADGPVGFGHRRLAIIDLAPRSRQPMTSRDGRIWITFNGEIYNFRALRSHLETYGHRFRTESDTEVLLAAYEEYGVDCLAQLRGMFAFAIWDGRDRSLFIARDRVGKKPLHYRLDRDGIAFASEPKAFLAEPSFTPEPDPEALAHYLSLQYVPSPLSAFRGVHKLPPAHYLLVRGERPQVRRYWRLRYTPKRTLSEDEAREQLLEHLTEAVRLRLVSDVPLGAFLSGGIDSSAVVALMSQMGAGPVKTFSIGFDEGDYDELAYARLVARRWGTDHQEFIVRPTASEDLPRIVWHYNEPYADESAIPTYYLSRLTRQHVTVAVNGDGGDENFAGYRRYPTSSALAAYDCLPPALRRMVQTLGWGLAGTSPARSLARRGRRWLDRAALPASHRYAMCLMRVDPNLRRRLFAPEFLEIADRAATLDPLIATYDGSDAPGALEAMMDVDLNHYLPDCLLVKVDIATMACGLEGRSPLLDHCLMEFVASLPATMKLRGRTAKYILKKAVADLLPPETIGRPKMGFGVPLDHWFRRDLLSLVRDVLLSRQLASRGYFRPDSIRELIDDHASGRRSWHDQLWTLLMLELWHRVYIDSPSRRATAGDPAGAMPAVAAPQPEAASQWGTG